MRKSVKEKIYIYMKNEQRTFITKNELLTRILPENLNRIVHNARCSLCNKETIIMSYEDCISVFDNGDVLLEGVCGHCGERVNRVIELGENQD